MQETETALLTQCRPEFVRLAILMKNLLGSKANSVRNAANPELVAKVQLFALSPRETANIFFISPYI
jgi:hypothetical protein